MNLREVATLVSWPRVLEEAGADPGRGGRTRCHLHGGDNPSSFSYDETIGRAHCFACEWSGDKIAFLQATLGLDFSTALARLAEMAGVRLSFHKPDRAELARAKAHRNALEAARNAYETWAYLRLQSAADEHQELLADGKERR